MILPLGFKPFSGSSWLKGQGMQSLAKPMKAFLTQSLYTSFSNLPSPAAHLCSQADLGSIYICFQQNMPDCVEPANPCAGLLPSQLGLDSPSQYCTVAVYLY